VILTGWLLCGVLDITAAKLVSASGGEPPPSKCDRFKPAKAISLRQ
jgi:hypothetical protein